MLGELRFRMLCCALKKKKRKNLKGKKSYHLHHFYTQTVNVMSIHIVGHRSTELCHLVKLKACILNKSLVPLLPTPGATIQLSDSNHLTTWDP